ncbi:MAG: hypothetical protein ACRDZN_04645, partial [Acidimicrobiales bacterium]
MSRQLNVGIWTSGGERGRVRRPRPFAQLVGWHGEMTCVAAGMEFASAGREAGRASGRVGAHHHRPGHGGGVVARPVPGGDLGGQLGDRG